MMTESAWDVAGNKEGLEIWAVEVVSGDGHVLKIPQEEFGKFYMGSSYIILSTKVTLNTGDLESNIHFWIGANTIPGDERVVVLKAMELDDILGGARVKYRECQGNESPLFVSFFKAGIRYNPGIFQRQSVLLDSTDGISSSTKKEKENHVKGKRNVRVHEVEVSVGSMNKGDCFILDTPSKVWVYLGRYSKRVEKVKAVQAANSIWDQDHDTHSSSDEDVEVIDMKSLPDRVDAFFIALGGGCRDEVAEPLSQDDDDVTLEMVAQKLNSVTLYRVSDASGEVKVEQVGVNSLSAEALSSSDCFILDASAQTEIYVWIGKSCTQQEKAEAFAHAGTYLVAKGYPPSTQIQCIVDGREPSSFKQFFPSWSKSLLGAVSPPAYGAKYNFVGVDRAAGKQLFSNPNLTTISVAKKHAKLLRSLGTCISFCPDDGSTGRVELWRVENFDLVPVPSAKWGTFFGGDSYVLKYSYGDDGYIIYYWQGKQSTQDEISASALHAMKLDQEVLLWATLIRVQQGYEPAHFLRIFRGRIVIFLGGHASGFRNRRGSDENTIDPGKATLFRVKSTCQEDTRAVQVELLASSLDSDDTFILEGGKECPRDYIWIGGNSSHHEKQMAQDILALVLRSSYGDDNVAPGRDASSAVTINEEEEPAEFWKLLGGKGSYTTTVSNTTTTSELAKGVAAYRARLFHCSIPEEGSSHNGKLKVEEVFNFTQEELYEDDVMVLDTGGDEIFVWLGKGATSEERTYSTHMADDYIQWNSVRRDGDGGAIVAVSIVIKQGYEPDLFKTFFLTWDNHYWTAIN